MAKPKQFRYKTKPFDHQDRIFKKRRTKKAFGLFGEQGTGKTKILLDIAAWLYIRDHIDFVLIIAPNDVHANWIDQEIPIHLALPDSQYSAATFRSQMRVLDEKKVVQTLDPDSLDDKLGIVAMNIESVIWPKGKGLIDFICNHYRVMCIVDESDRIGNQGAQVTKHLLKIRRKFACRWIATGTPLDSSPLAAWSQFGFLNIDIPLVTDMAWGAFRVFYSVMQSKKVITKKKKTKRVKFVVGHRNLAKLKAAIEPYHERVLKKDCLDLPPKLYKTIRFPMSKEQNRLYQEMKEHMITEYEGVEIFAQIPIVKLLRLSRISGGFADKGLPIKDGCAKLEYIKNEVPRMGQSTKVIIWCRFIDEMEAVYSLLPPEQTLRYWGETSKDERAVAKKRFRTDDQIRFMVANPTVAGVGLTLIESTISIYYSNNYQLRIRRQSEDRNHRIGQTNKVLYIDLVTENTIDESVLKSLRAKKNLSDFVLNDPIETWI